MNDIDKHRASESFINIGQDGKDLLAQLSDFVEHSSIPLRWVDGNGIIIWANQSELDLLGYSREAYIGKPFRDFHLDQQLLEDIFSSLLRDDVIHDMPAKLLHSDGTIRHVMISSSIWRVNGEFVHTRCFTRDITAEVVEQQRRSQLVELLQENESRLRLAIDSTKLGTWDWNRERGKMYWSAESKKILGLAMDRHITFREFLERVASADWLAVNAKVNDIMNNSVDGNIDLTFRIRRFDNDQIRWIKIQGTLFTNTQNKLNRFLGAMLDITDTVIADEQNALLAAIITSSNDAIVAKTVDGIVTTWNRAAEKLFGYSQDEIVGESILTIIPDDRHAEENFILSSLRAGESIEHYETKRLRKDGSQIDVSLTISPIRDQSGQIMGISKIARDITERKQEEKRKNDFVAIVSHELKTPLTSILLYAQLLVKKSRTLEEGSFFKISSKIESYVKRMNSMISDYLGISRIEEGRIDVQPSQFNLLSLALEVMEEGNLISSIHDFKIIGCEGVELHADREKMRQVLINLVSNAAKYSPNGGSVILRCEDLSDKFRISVSDEGLGISLENQKKLFQRFYRVSDDYTRNISGFGIGLYLVSELLKMHGSAIALDSEPGKGSTFFFDLPK